MPIDEERLAAIEQSLAKLDDASGKAVDLPKVDIRDVAPSEVCQTVGQAFANGIRMGELY